MNNKKIGKNKSNEEFSFEDLSKELKKVTNYGSIMASNTFSEVDEYIHTGNYILNACLTGSLKKGYPNNRSVCLAGPSGVGKTYLMLNAAKSAQSMGYYVAWYDSENAVDKELMEKFGIDTSKVWYEPCNTIEEFRTSVTNLTEKLIEAKRANKNIPKIIVFLDSIGNLASLKEVSDAITGVDKADMTRAKKIKSVFRILTTRMAEVKIPFIFSNHVYSTQDFISQLKTSGGTGPEYAASIILILTKAKINEKVKDDNGKKVNKQVGILITVSPLKNRFAKANKIKIHLHYDRGMNPYVGLESYLSWENCGIGRGDIIPESKIKEKDKNKIIQNGIKYIDENTKEVFYYLPDIKAKTIAVKHLNRSVTINEFYSPLVFTDEVLDKIDKVIYPLFNYGINEESLDEDLLNVDIEDSEKLDSEDYA